MALFGAHVSSTGSILKAFERAKEIGAEVFQFFLRSPRTWRWKGAAAQDLEEFSLRLREFRKPVMVHAPYLLNLASPNEHLRKRSIDVFVQELSFCDGAGIHFYNFHPGTAKGVDENEGLCNIIRSLEEVLKLYEPKRTWIILENTAGSRGDLGKSFEELHRILKAFPGVNIGVCIDTCHAFSYGYGINSERGFKSFLIEIEKTVGFERIKAVHANDSKVPLGAKKDRHEHIGRGYIGDDGFVNLLKHEYFSKLPYYIETPKERNMDVLNLKRLRELASV